MPNLTQRLVASLKPQKADQFIRDEGLTGFGVKVSVSGRVSFFAEARVRGGRTRRKVLGQHPAMTVANARKLAADFIYKAHSGIDPVAEVRSEKARKEALSKSLGEVFEEYIKARDLRPKTIKDYRGTFALVFGDWMQRPIRSITRSEVEERFEQTRKNRGLASAGLASRVLNAVCVFAMADEKSGERLLFENPVDVLKQRRYKRTAPRRSRYLDENEINRLVTFFFTERDWPETPIHGVTDQGVNYVMLLLLTGLRKSEALSLAWDDVDMFKQVLIARDTKNHTDHYVPISQGTDWILKRQHQISQGTDWVFPARRGKGHMTEPRSQLDKIKKATKLKFTFHDLRRTFATHAANNGAEFNMIRRALNHRSGGGVTDQYIITQIDMLRPVFDAVSRGYRRYVGEDGE